MILINLYTRVFIISIRILIISLCGTAWPLSQLILLDSITTLVTFHPSSHLCGMMPHFLPFKLLLKSRIIWILLYLIALLTAFRSHEQRLLLLAWRTSPLLYCEQFLHPRLLIRVTHLAASWQRRENDLFDLGLSPLIFPYAFSPLWVPPRASSRRWS